MNSTPAAMRAFWIAEIVDISQLREAEIALLRAHPTTHAGLAALPGVVFEIADSGMSLDRSLIGNTLRAVPAYVTGFT